jgi:hypothetical protein
MTCFCHVSFWSRYSPKYCTSVWTGICILSMVTCGQVIRFVVNVTCNDFVWFILIFHLLYHCWRRFKWCWRCDAAAGSLFAASNPFLSNGSVKTCLQQCGYCWKRCFVFGPCKVVRGETVGTIQLMSPQLTVGLWRQKSRRLVWNGRQHGIQWVEGRTEAK